MRFILLSGYQLLPSENRVVLEHIATASQEYRTMLNEMGELKSLLDKAPLFMILFVAATLLKDRDKHTDIDLNDGVLTAFQKIIANKILVLEEDGRHHGLGKAIYLLAKIYASEKMGYTLFPEDFFLKTASIMGKNEDLVERIKMDGYPDEVNALISKNTVTSKKNVDYRIIQFNHDVIAEQGIVYANSHKKELATALSFDKYGLTKLFDAIAVNTSPIGVIMLWLWLHTEWELDVDEKAIKQLFEVLQIGAQNVNGGVFNAILLALPTQDLRKRVCQFILELHGFYTLSHFIVSMALNKASVEAAKKAAETILSQTDFFSTMPNEIVCTALNKASAEAAKKAAETILSQTDFFTLSHQIVSTALQILGCEESALQAAKTIVNNLKQSQPFLVFQAIKTLLLSNEEEDCVLIHKVVDEINLYFRSKNKGFMRLYYDLLYLPLFDIPTHHEKVRRVFNSYQPTAKRHAKHNVYKVLNCYNEYSGISYFQSKVKALCRSILSTCIIDIEYQYKEHPQELTFGHINYALRHPTLIAEAVLAKEKLLAYGQQHPNFQQTELYKEIAEIAVD